MKNNLQQIITEQGRLLKIIIKKYNELLPEVYPEISGIEISKYLMTRKRLTPLLKCKRPLSVIEIEIFSKILDIKPKELLN